MPSDPTGAPTDFPRAEVPTGPSGSVRLRTAFLVSAAGDWIYRFAVPTLILKITGSALSTAFAYVLEYIPYIVVGLFAGVLADRWDRRRIMVLCDTSSFVLALVIAGIATLHDPPVAALYVCALLLACVRPFYFPAFQGILVDLVPEHRLSRFNAWTQTVDSTLNMVGPVLGTMIVAVAGVPLATLINALSFSASAFLVYQISYLRPAPLTAAAKGAGMLTGVGRDFTEGFRLLWRNQAIRYGTGLMAIANLAGYIIEGNLVFLVLRVENLPKVAIGLVFGAQGLGTLIGALLAPRLIDRYQPGRLLVWGMGGSAAAMLLPFLIPHWWMVVVGWGSEGIATSIIIVSWFTARQRILPSEVQGRIVSVSRAAAYATIPLGAVVGGWLATSTGTGSPIRAVFGYAGAIQAGVFLGTALSPVARMNADSTGPSDSPASAGQAEQNPVAADPVGWPDR